MKLILLILGSIGGATASIFLLRMWVHNTVENVKFRYFKLTAKLKNTNITHKSVQTIYDQMSIKYDMVYKNQQIPKYKTFVAKYGMLVSGLNTHIQQYYDNSKPNISEDMVEAINIVCYSLDNVINSTHTDNKYELDVITKALQTISGESTK